MRATWLLGASLLTACGGGDDSAAWTDGPAGHVYVYNGSLYDLDASDGHTLRVLRPDDSIAQTMRAGESGAYFQMADAAGQGHTYQLTTTGSAITMLAATSFNPIGVVGRELIGQFDERKVVRLDLDSGATTMFDFPSSLASGVLACQSGSLYEHTLYLACLSVTATGSTAGMLTYDLDAATFGTFVPVKSDVMPISLSSNVDGTPAGAMFTLYEGTATAGTRTVYKIDHSGVSAGVVVPGTANDLDEQTAIGATVYLPLNPDNVIVPFDAMTMTPGTPIAIDHPRYVRSGGGVLWSSSKQHAGTLVKIDPTTRTLDERTFTGDPIATEINALAYGGT